MKLRISAIVLTFIIILSTLFVGWNFVFSASNPNEEFIDISNRSTESRNNRGINWSQVQVISEPILGNNFNTVRSMAPAIAVEDNRIYVVWYDTNNTNNAGPDFDIFYRYFDGSSWAEIQVISEPVFGQNFNTGMSRYPSIAIENGNIYVAWMDMNNTNGAWTDIDIFYRANLTGSGWGPIQVISEPVFGQNSNNQPSQYPDIAVDNGDVYVAWNDLSPMCSSGTDGDVFYRCNLTGSSWGPVQVISEPVFGQNLNVGGSYDSEIAVENGNINVVWTDKNNTSGAGNDDDIFYRHFNGSGWGPIQVISEPIVGQNINLVSWGSAISVDNGKVYVVWNSNNNTTGAGGDYDIFYRCNLSGSSWEPVQVISEPVPNQNINIGYSWKSAIAVVNNKIYVIWQDNDNTNGCGGGSSDTETFFRCNLSGSGWEPVQVISEPIFGQNINTANSVDPSIAVENNTIHVVWCDINDTNNAGTDEDIFYISTSAKLSLLFPMVTPVIGNTSSEFNFTVAYYHLNNSSPTEIKAIIDDIEYPMLEDDPADTSYFDGKKYYFKLKNFDMGAHTYYYYATNGTKAITTSKKNFQVRNTLPKIITQNNRTAYEDTYYSVNYEFEDMDVDNVGQSCYWNYSTNASWLKFVSNPASLYGTPGNDDVGEYWVSLIINDSIGTDQTNFILTVKDVNDKPIITTTNIESTNEDEVYSVEYSATDIDSPINNQIWSLETNASSWLNLNTTSNAINGMPTNDDVGDHWVNVSVTDGEGGADSTNFTLTVLNVNDPPIITTEDITLAVVNEPYQVNYTAVDIDSISSKQLWSIETNAGSWLAIDHETGVLSGTPRVTDIGLLDVNVSVSDGDGGFDWQVFKLTVITGNTPPIITTMDIDSVVVNTLYEVDYNATDDYTPNNELIWALETNASWLTIDPETGVLSGTPTETDVGWYQVNVSVFDGVNGWDNHYFVLTVTKEPIVENIPPILTNPKIKPIEGNIETEFTFSVHYYDIDNDPPDSINVVIDNRYYTMILKLGENPLNGIYEYKTKLTEGNHTYYFKASDGKDIASTDTFSTPNIQKIETESGKGSQKETSWDWVIGVVIVIIILIILAVLFVLKKRKKRLVADVEYIPSRDAKDLLAAGTAAKPGAIAAPTVIIDQVAPAAQQTQIQAPPTSAAVPGKTPAIPAASAEPTPQLPPAKIEAETSEVKPEPTTPVPAVVPIPAPIPEPTPTPAPVHVTAIPPESPEPVEEPVDTDFGIEGGPKPVQKDAVEHDVAVERVVEETDIGAATADLQAAAVVEPTEKGAVIHDADTTIWRPDEKGKVEENKEVLEQLKTLAELKDKGALTEEEFERKKKELLG